MESTKSLTTVNRIRGTLKTKSSRIKTFLENFQQPESEAETRIILESKLELICDIKNSIKELFIQYAELPDATEISQAVTVLEEIEVETEQSEVSLKILLSKLKSPVNNVNNTVNNLPEPNDSKPPALKFTLPQIPLETFSGNVLNFQSFKQQFMSIIGQNNDLTEVQKLYYLKASLRGDVKLLESCQDTYESLWATLEARFENKRAVVNAHANNILNYAKLSESPTQLRLFIDSVKGNLRALKLLDLERNTLSDTLLLNVLVSKLPQETRKEYEFTIKTNNLPSLDDFIEFLELRTRVLDSLTKANYVPSKNNTSGFFPKTIPASAHQKSRSLLLNNFKSNKQLCTMPNCSEFHPLFRCNKFKALNIQERIEHVKKFRYCFNCLSSSHYNTTKCLSDKFCGFCGNGNKHHTLLCKKNPNRGVSDQISGRSDSPPEINIEASKERHSDDVRSAEVTGSRGESNLTFVTRKQPADALERERGCFHTPQVALFSEGSERNQKNVILNTAVVYLTGADNKRYGFRSILDCGSTNSFISAQAANLLNLRKQKVYVPISGLNETALYVKSQICTKLSNENDDENWYINLLIVPKITSVTPSRYINCENLKIPKNIKLADKNFHIPAPVHVLLSAEHFFEFLRDGKIHVENSNLKLQSTCFGHVISGSVTQHSPPSVQDQTTNRVTLHSPPSIKDEMANQCFLSMNMTILNKTIASFWEVEEICEDHSTPSNELEYCNKHFEQTHLRQSDGRYIVKLPFKPGMEKEGSLGNSHKLASKRLNQLWTRLERDPSLKELYTQFLSEYKQLQHMEEITSNANPNEGYYFSHHHVWKESSSTTKLRVVFNGSSKTTNGKALNDILLKGGVVQEDLFAIILRFRKYIYALTADLRMMFRQILIDPSQIKYQKILWKEDIDAPIKTYALRTISYGTTPASYLATKTLHQLALDEADNFPNASKIVLTDFYMDDCLSGASSVEELYHLKAELIQLFASAGMELHKFRSNIDISSKLNFSFPFLQNNDTGISNTLGMNWHPSSDTLSYKVTTYPSDKVTKRNVLSQIARLFDPLGLLGPSITLAKIMMQSLWLLKISWTDQLPHEVVQQWNAFLKTLPSIEQLHIPRCVVQPNSVHIALNGFCDSSQKAYGAAIYLQSTTDNISFTNKLLCSKSRIAPLKTLTIPRLELQACLLLAKLISKVIKSLKMEIQEIRLFTDSTICLYWISTPPYLLKTFISNRVSQIQQLTNSDDWYHVSSEQNPSDCLSRGIDAAALIKHDIWWEGPPFLKQNFIAPSKTYKLSKDDSVYAELKTVSEASLVSTDHINFFETIFELTNSLSKLINIIVFLLRFLFNCRNPNSKRGGAPSSAERRDAQSLLVHQVQVKYFSKEKSDLTKGKTVATNSKLRFLNPFVDKNNIIRVGGRISNSNLSINKKFPIILPANHKFTKMLFLYYHLRDLHVGPQALLSAVRQNFWPINGRSTARQVVHACVKCFKAKPVVVEQLMGQLPPARVRPSPPFSHTGIDLCGPFSIKFKNQRKGIFQKVYIAIFICMVTKAVHFEAVTDLSAETFIAALKRFFSRRGKSKVIFSDNATNFTGANAKLKHLLNIVKNKDQVLSKFLSLEGLEWRFLPPRAPNQGGLWEAGVRSFKYHLKRNIGMTKLTLEEFLTITTQIEGILNSRPLTPLSSDVNDFAVLTPAHFLIGQPINAIPEPDLSDINESLLNRWQRTQKVVQTIWKVWSNSYLSHLQQRSKWQFQKLNVRPGMIVIVKDDQMPVNKWLIGRISDTFPGTDGNVRVVNINTPKGIIKRSIGKICLLPIEDNILNTPKTD